MNVIIKMPKNYWQAFKDYMTIANQFYNLQVEDAMTALFSDAFVKDNELHNVKENSNKLLRLLFDGPSPEIKYDEINKLVSKLKFEDGTYNLDEKDLKNICNYLDFIIRIVLGQWDEMYNIVTNSSMTCQVYADKDTKLGVIRNDMLPIFDKKCINSIFASFGIYNNELNEKILINYAIYKQILFALHGDTRDASICSTGYTEKITVQLPIKAEFVVGDSQEDTIKFLDENTNPKSLSIYRDALYVRDRAKLYVYVNPHVSIETAPGTKISVQYNSWPIVERDGKTYAFDTPLSI